MAFDTPLNAENEKRFKNWLVRQQMLTSRDYSKDLPVYDLRGWWLENNGADAPDGHFTDTYKKPSHPTFSTDSKYHGTVNPTTGQKNVGGQWVVGPDNQWRFTPASSQTNTANKIFDLIKKWKRASIEYGGSDGERKPKLQKFRDRMP
jgi:hypothetical protein